MKNQLYFLLLIFGFQLAFTPASFGQKLIQLDPDLKQNLFKQKVRKVRKINDSYLQQMNKERYA